MITIVRTGWVLLLAALAVCAREGVPMQRLQLTIDGRPARLEPAARQEGGEVWVPVHAFSEAVGAEAKEVEPGRLAVCREDLCIPIDEGRQIEGVLFAPLAGLGQALGLEWEIAEGALALRARAESAYGLGAGQVPPPFELPDLYSGERVSPQAYRGKPCVFYMWASW